MDTVRRGGVVGKEKLGGLPGERLSLVHRYMTDVAAEAVPEPKPTDVSPPEPEPTQAPPPIAPLLAEASTPLPDPGLAPAVSTPLHRLPIHEWSRADAIKAEREDDVDWPHEVLRLRVERDRAGETPS